jgi:hypothetical protein
VRSAVDGSVLSQRRQPVLIPLVTAFVDNAQLPWAYSDENHPFDFVANEDVRPMYSGVQCN